MYRALITVGERGTEKTTEELSEQCGLSTERVDEAAEKLVHINLPDMYETIKNGEYRKHIIYSAALILSMFLRFFGLRIFGQKI